MKELPNGLVVFNATPHPITFWDEGWDAPIIVQTDEKINAGVAEKDAFYIPGKCPECGGRQEHEEEIYGRECFRDSIFPKATFVRVVFEATQEGRRIANAARLAGADVIVGSIIAAQAYPSLVVGMVPAPGYERVAPAEKRMRPNKFTTF